MFVDFRSDEAPASIQCDVCIVGAGAAGITIAQALIDTPLEVCLVESGGLDPSPEHQSLYDGAVLGLQNASPTACRVRCFGGTTHHWTGWCRPLDDLDFEMRPWIVPSGWPFRKAELEPYYRQAQDIVQIGWLGFSDDVHREGDTSFPAFDPAKVHIGFFRFSPPTRFGTVYRQQLGNAGNVTVLLHANALRLETDSSASTVRRVQLRSLQGKVGTVTAHVVVVACGAMENARLLLLSNQMQPAGLGNGHDLVGRYFMQHIEGVVADILAADPAAIARSFAKYQLQGVGMRAEIALSEHVQRQDRLLNSGFTIDAGVWRSAGYQALRRIWKDLRSGRWPTHFADSLAMVLKDLQTVGRELYQQEDYALKLYVRAESIPDPQSRITLGPDPDAFGLPRIRVDWRLTPFDRHSIAAATRRVAAEFGRLDIGRLRLADWVADEEAPWPQPLWGGCHHMGTTRMADDARSGVVDRNCRVHGLDNLYMAGSSVFPTAGYVPPTLTIVALALRLAGHLRQHHA